MPLKLARSPVWHVLPSIVLVAVILLFAGALYQYYYRSTALATNQAYLKAGVTWLTASHAGEVTALYVSNTQHVKPQQPLLHIADLDAPRRQHQQQALLDVKQNALEIHQQNEQAQRTLLADAQNKILLLEQQRDGRRQDQEKLQRLFDAGFVTRMQLDDGEFRMNQVESQLQLARSTHQAIRTQYEHLVSSGGGLTQELAVLQQSNASQMDAPVIQVVAPVAGLVSSLSVRQGSQVSAGARLLAIVDMQQAYVEAQFSPEQIEQMFVGQPVRLEVEGFEQQALYGTITSLPVDHLSIRVRTKVRRLPVKIEFDHSLQQLMRYQPLRPGLAVNVQVLTPND